MASIFHQLSASYQYVVENGDPRGSKYPFVSSPVPMIVTVVLYLIFTQYGPRFFQDKKPMGLKPLITVYNFFMVLLSAYMLKEFCMAAYMGKYSFMCQPYDRNFSPSSMRMAYACWLYFMSKFVETADTVFLVVRKKGDLSFLHVFHHASVIFQMWFLIKYVPNGHGTFHAGCNCFVHTVMYTYYFMACFPALKKYLWWKKYLTMLQLGQFFLVIIHIFIGLYNECEYPRWPVYMAFSELIPLIILFGNYYMQTYLKNKRHAVVQKDK